MKDWKGWGIHIQVIMAASDVQNVLLSTGNQWDGEAPMFATNAGKSFSQYLTLDYQHPTAAIDQPMNVQTGVWETTLYIPASGCYYLNASWPNGGWHISFAAGR